MPTSMPTAKPTSRPTSMPTAMGGEPGPLCQPTSMPTIMPTAKGGEPGPRCQPTSGPLENLKLVCLLYPALSMMVTVSGDDARHASDHDTKGHALCVPSPCSIRHACALSPSMRAIPYNSHAWVIVLYCGYKLRKLLEKMPLLALVTICMVIVSSFLATQ